MKHFKFIFAFILVNQAFDGPPVLINTANVTRVEERAYVVTLLHQPIKPSYSVIYFNDGRYLEVDDTLLNLQERLGQAVRK